MAQEKRSTLDMALDHLMAQAPAALPEKIPLPANASPFGSLMVNLDHDLNGKNQKLNMEWDGPRSHYIVHIRGAFYLPERQTRSFKVETPDTDC